MKAIPCELEQISPAAAETPTPTAELSAPAEEHSTVVNTTTETVVDPIEQAITQLLTGDFHSRWDQAKQFSRRFAQWGDRAVPVLISHLNAQEDPDAQWFLVRMLSQFDRPEVVSVIASLLVTTHSPELKTEASKALTALGDSAISTLTELLSANNPLPQRRLAARTLSHIRRGATVKPLLSIATDPDAALRVIATEALGSFHAPAVTPILLAALSDEPDICLEAVRALGRRRDLLTTIDLVEPLAQCLRSPHEQIACESAKALGRLGHESAIAALGDLLLQPVAAPVKVAAVRALSWIGGPTATTALVTAFGLDTLQVPPPVSLEIIKALGQTRSASLKPSVAQVLINRLRDISSAFSPTASPTASPLDGAQSNHLLPLSEPVIFSMKQALISALAQLGQPEAISCLIPFLGDSEPRIKMHALSALTQIDPRVSQAKIQHYLADEQIAVEIRAQVKESLSAW